MLVFVIIPALENNTHTLKLSFYDFSIVLVDRKPNHAYHQVLTDSGKI